MPELIAIDKVYFQIQEQRNILVSLLNESKQNPISPARLSDVCMKLGILNELLGEHVADLKRLQLEAEQKAYAAAKEAQSSDTGAANASRMSTVKERYEFEKANTKHSDIWKVISMAQSHIRAETEERRGM